MTDFFKGHGLGNDYIALQMEGLGFELTPLVVRLMCDRHNGIGSDGLLARVPSDAADFGVRIFNPDGSEAEKSGNGLRIFAAYLLEGGHVAEHAPFTVQTPGGTVRMEILGQSLDGVLEVEVEMGTAIFRSADVGLGGPDRETDGEPLELESGDVVHVNTVSIGNPHCVVFQDELDVETLRRRAPQISTHPRFARGVNVQFAVPVEPDGIEAWVWERGAGETRASGSSACAVAAAAVRRGMVSERQVTVRMPGGALHVHVRDDWSLVLRGPVESVCRGTLTDGMRRRLEMLG
ncbi:MAG TPA: diaminopimelate epimerase [Longimicrobium sp.]|uniref:diaminopimelate epimerase n=1 Tax=Longimicrobium sp. TaxID=2029185 RepID=UPI002EDB4E0E